MFRNERVAPVGVARVEHGLHVGDGHVEIAETFDHLRLRDLLARTETSSVCAPSYLVKRRSSFEKKSKQVDRRRSC
jgi:hypothetical protein